MKHALHSLPLSTLALLLLALAAPPLSAQETKAGAAKAPVQAPAKAPAPTKAAPALPSGGMGDIQLTQIRLDDAARLLSQVGKANVVVTGKVADLAVSLYLRDATVDDMVRNLCRAAGVWYRFDTPSKTYVIMSSEEYQKDLAIVRDEQTRVFTLRHHNVVATANAIKALFGARVALSNPIEEMPPISLGSGARTDISGGVSSSTANDPTQVGAKATATTTGAAGASGAVAPYDPTADLGRLSPERLGGQRRPASGDQPTLSIAELQDMAARQGPPIHVTYNKLNNLLLARTGDEQALRQIGQLIDEMDKPPKQVLLEMKILEVTLDNGFRSAFDVGFAGKGRTDGPTPIGTLPKNPTTGHYLSGSEYARNGGQSGLFGVEQNATLIWQHMSNALSLRFQLLAQENKLKILSSPMLVAANNQQARLFIGDERVLTVGATSQTTTGTTGASNTQITVKTEKRDVGQTLSILPRINGDRSISLTIDQDSSTVKIGDGTIPIATGGGEVIHFPIDTVNTATLKVTAHAQDGMTVAIGGMIRDKLQRDDEKVPLLGDIPILGYLFKRDLRASVRSQIVLLITPRVLENPEEANNIAQAKTQDFNAAGASFPTSPVVPRLPGTSPQPATNSETPGL